MSRDVFELHRIVIDFLHPLQPLQLEPCPPQLIDASRHVKTWNRRRNSGCCRRATTKRLRSRRRVFAATNEQKNEEKREAASAPQSHGLSQMPGADMASRSNAQTFQNCLLERRKNVKRNRGGISAKISRCCRSCRLPEAAP